MPETGLLRHDPTGTSPAMTDEAGYVVGELLYDGYGAVLTSTLPLTLTDTLVEFPDGATGLVHLGEGRWYDPALGRPLQPNAAGGPPSVPQALNRYAATPLGQPGVVQAEIGSGLPQSVVRAVGLNAVSAASGMALSTYANSLSGELFVRANDLLLARAGYQSLFRRILPPGRGRSAFYLTELLVEPAGGRTYRVLATGELIDLDHLEAQVLSKRWPVTYPEGEAFSALDDSALKQILRSWRGEFAANFAINTALALPELAEPWQNPYFSPGQRLVQNAVTIGGAATAAGAAVWVGNLAAASSLGGPVTLVLVTGTGVTVYVVWEHAVKPAVSWIAIASGLPDPYTEYRNLKRLGGTQ